MTLAMVVGSVLLLAAWKLSSRSSDLGGNGQVTGIVGRMGSGKSYMAVRMAERRMRTGSRVVTNFSMKLVCPDGKHRRRHCPCKLAEQWRQWHGWEDFIGLEDAVVIIDEAHLMAPSLDPRCIPEVAKWKLSMARKYKLDLYWITQHEDRVTRTLRDLTNEIYVCSAWFGGLVFAAKGYEASQVRKGGRHAVRKMYRFKLATARLYDTLEIMAPDRMVDRDGTMRLAPVRRAGKAGGRQAPGPARQLGEDDGGDEQ